MSREKPAFAVRLPPKPGDVEAFVSGQGQQPAANGQTLSVQQPAASGRRRRGIVTRAGGTERARVTVYLDVTIAERLRRYAFERGVDISELAADAIEQMVSGLFPEARG